MSKILENLTAKQLTIVARESGYADVNITEGKYTESCINGYYVYDCTYSRKGYQEYTAHVYVVVKDDKIILEF